MSLASNDPAADYYISAVRGAQRRGLPVRSRPAVDRHEALQAREVQRLVDQVVLALPMTVGDASASGDAPDRTHCACCGRAFTSEGDGWCFRSVYTKRGRQDWYKCVGGCSAQHGSEEGEAVA